MFTLNATNGRYEATLKAGTQISISQAALEDYAFNCASLARCTGDTRAFSEVLTEKRDLALNSCERWRTRHNGFSVIVTSVKALRK